MANYTVQSFADYDDFVAYVQSLATTTEIQFEYVPEKGYIVIVG